MIWRIGQQLTMITYGLGFVSKNRYTWGCQLTQSRGH
jgi:hypothetical protein